MLPELGCTHALLLQGPMGPFFRRFADELDEAGVQVTTVCFNGGDRFFLRGREAVEFREPMDRWPAFVEALVTSRGVDAVFLFGDGRPIHRAAIEVLERLGVRFYVFEEGYLRPDFVTLEAGGVNGHSRLSRDPAVYRRALRRAPRPLRSKPVGRTFGRAALHATLYVLAMALGRARFPHYVHHRRLEPAAEAFAWVRGGLRKLVHAVVERGAIREYEGQLFRRFFLVPLQVHCDYQLSHSRFESMEAFMRAVTAEFVAHARKDMHLVFKHHPMDRAYTAYDALVEELRREHGLGARLHYVHDLHLPSLLKSARGVITINSTVGLQALHHGTPVKVLGDAIYDLPGLTHQGTLEAFLRAPGEVDRRLYRSFRRYLLHVNQANGSFHRRLPGYTRGTGMRWFPGTPGSAPPGE